MNSLGVSLVPCDEFFMLIWVCGHVSRRFTGVKNKLELGLFILHNQDIHNMKSSFVSGRGGCRAESVAVPSHCLP